MNDTKPEVEETEEVDETTDDATDTDDAEGEAKGKAKVHKANREAANLRARLKAAEEKAKLWDEHEESSKTEAQKIADRAEAAEKRAAELESKLLRADVATEKGLTANQAKFLTGTTKEELLAAADELKEAFASSGEPKRERPGVGDLSGGSDPSSGVRKTPSEHADAILGISR